MEKVALYLRKSRDEDCDDIEILLKRHETQLRDYCKRNNLYIVKIYREVVSGGTIENRPEMQQLLDEVSARSYNGVVVMDLERLSRGNQLDQLEILETFKGANTKIYTLNKVYDLTNEEIDEEYFEFSLFMSRREYKVIRRRLMRGRAQALRDGYFIASICPFGYDKEKRGRGWVLVPNDDAPFVRDIFNMYLNGRSTLDIAKYLNNNGAKPVMSELFTEKAVSRILHNKTYAGYLYKKTEGVYYKGLHDPIISEDVYAETQALLALKHPRHKYNSELINPLASILKCKKCGRTMTLLNGKIDRCYACPNLNCDNIASYQSQVETKLLNELKTELKDFDYILENYEKAAAEKKLLVEKEIKALKKDTAKRAQMLEKAYEMLEEGIYSKEVFKSRSAALERAISENQKQIDALGSETLEKENIKTAVPVLQKVLDNYETLTPAEKNKLLKVLIKKIDYEKNKRSKRYHGSLDDFELTIYLNF